MFSFQKGQIFNFPTILELTRCDIRFLQEKRPHISNLFNVSHLKNDPKLSCCRWFIEQCVKHLFVAVVKKKMEMHNWWPGYFFFCEYVVYTDSSTL